LEQSVENEVERAYQQYSTARMLMETFEKNMLDQARDVRRNQRNTHTRAEKRRLSEFLDAQRPFNDTLQGYTEERAEFASNSCIQSIRLPGDR
jgi:hypothetical protein